jgi:hypothetical protein
MHSSTSFAKPAFHMLVADNSKTSKAVPHAPHLLELVQLLCAQQHPPAAASSSRLNKDAPSIVVTQGACTAAA